MGDEQRLQVATTVIKSLQAENAYLKDTIKDLRGAVMKMDDHIRELTEANKQIQEKNVEYQDQRANFVKLVAALMKMSEEDASEMGALELQAEESYIQAQTLKKKYGKSRNIKKSNKQDTEFKDGEAKPEHAIDFVDGEAKTKPAHEHAIEFVDGEAQTEHEFYFYKDHDKGQRDKWCDMTPDGGTYDMFWLGPRRVATLAPADPVQESMRNYVNKLR
jgi:predicted RNase H-like nuclease (RuvC/YqgF family)